MSLSRYTLFALATLYIICACEKIEPEKEGSNKDKSEEQIPGDPTPTIVGDTVTVSKGAEFPEPWTLWNGHVVVDTFMYDNSVDILLLAKEEFSAVHSYYNEIHSGDAWRYTNRYSEEGITEWEIPDETVAEYLRDNCNKSTNLDAVNELLKNSMTIYPYNDSGSGNARYLCRSNDETENAQATSTFAFVAGSSILKAGKSATYKLRPVKWITLKKEE